MRKLYIQMALRDSYGNTHAVISHEVPDECAYFGERYADDLRLDAEIGLASMTQVVQRLQVKQVRRDALKAFCKVMGDLMASHLEDKEGWHGVERQEKVLDTRGTKGETPA